MTHVLRPGLDKAQISAGLSMSRLAEHGISSHQCNAQNELLGRRFSYL